MNVKHCDGLSWFSRRGESHEQDGKRLSRATKIRVRTASGDPAMASGPSRYRRANNSLRRRIGSDFTLPDEGRISLRSAPKRADNAAHDYVSGECSTSRSGTCNAPRRYERDSREADAAGTQA